MDSRWTFNGPATSRRPPSGVSSPLRTPLGVRTRGRCSGASTRLAAAAGVASRPWSPGASASTCSTTTSPGADRAYCWRFWTHAPRPCNSASHRGCLDHVIPPQHLAPPMDPGQVSFSALVAGTLSRWRTTVTVAAGIVLLALALAVILPPSYRADASFVTTDAGLKLNTGGLADLAAEP